jgi:hypothetical protein
MDDGLSPSALIKFKNLYQNHSCLIFVIPFITFPPAYFCNKWFVGKCYCHVGFANRGLASTRFNVMGMALMYPLFLYLGYTLPIHRKLFT